MAQNSYSTKCKSQSKKCQSSKEQTPITKESVYCDENETQHKVGKDSKSKKQDPFKEANGTEDEMDMDSGYHVTPRRLQSKSEHDHTITSEYYHPVLDRLRRENNLNPKILDLPYMMDARYFVLKSEGEFDIYCSLKYSIWTSTSRGNQVLNNAFYDQARFQKGPVYLFFSVTGSGHFYGMAQMMSPLDYNTSLQFWYQSNKWKGQFKLKWMYVKDVPNALLQDIKLENNDNKPVTYSRDAQEVLPSDAQKVIKVLHSYKHKTTIFDDFSYYEEKEKRLIEQM